MSGAERPLQSDRHLEGGTVDSSRADGSDVTKRLSEGLKTCRSVVENYRSLMLDNSTAHQPSHGPGDDEAFNDNAGN